MQILEKVVKNGEFDVEALLVRSILRPITDLKRVVDGLVSKVDEIVSKPHEIPLQGIQGEKGRDGIDGKNGKDGITIASNANPIPVQLTTTTTLPNKVSFANNGTTLDSFERLRVSDARVAFEFNFNAQTPTLASTIWESTAYGASAITGPANLYLGVGVLSGTATIAPTIVASINWKEIL